MGNETRAIVRYLRPGQAGELLGVSGDTIAGWCDDGALPCMRTVGGHRRIPASAVQAFKAQNSPHRTQKSSSGEARHGDPEPGPQEGGGSAAMPAGSFGTQPAGNGQEV